MPEGLVRWYDSGHGDAEIVHDNRAYHAPPGAIEAAARHPGARVHFDIETRDGSVQAVDVRLRQSARASRHRHRFGTLAAARRFDTKGPAPTDTTHPELHLAASHPLQVARSWATCVSRADTAGAMPLYAPGAVVHVRGRSLRDHTVRRWLESLPVFGCERHATIHGQDGGAVVTWGTTAPGEQGLRVTCKVAHGQIAEQWELGATEPAGAATPTEDETPISIFTDGDVGERATTRARRFIDQVVATLEEPVLFARMKLAYAPDPARVRRARAEALLDLNGEPLRAHATARTMDEAMDVLEHRLRDRLEHRARRRLDLHRSDGIAGPGEWRHGDLAPQRPPFFDRPVEERQLVRHKTFAIGELTCDEAIFDMDQLDYDFYLFVDLATGLDSVVERTEGGYRMTRCRPAAAALGPTAQPVELSEIEVPELGLPEAIERLGASGEHHLFFTDAQSGRGCVLYLRYDGHYGLITPE